MDTNQTKPNQEQPNIPNENQSNKKQIIVGLFTDPESPFAKAPIKVQEIMREAKQGNKINHQKIKLDKLGFGLRPTEDNFCNHFFVGGQQTYYVCSDCSYNQSGVGTMCFCSSCFEAQKHVGHNFYTNIPYSDSAYCDCGRIERIKKQSFCNKHSKFDQQIQCQITQTERQQFISTFVSLFQCSLYDDESPHTTLIQKIIKQLQRLNQSSVFYNKLTFQVLTKPSKYLNNDKKNCLLLFLSERNQFEKLSIQIGGDLTTRKKYIKFLCQVYDKKDKQNIKSLLNNQLRQVLNLTVIQKLLQQGFTHEIFDKIFESIEVTESSKQVYEQYVLQKIKNSNLILDSLQIKQTYITKKLSQAILIHTINNYPSNQKIEHFIKGNQTIQSNPWANIQVIQNKQQIHQNLPFSVKKAHQFILNNLSSNFVIDLQRFKNVGKYLQNLGISSNKLDEILYWMVLSIKDLSYNQNQQSKKQNIITILLLISKSSNKKVLLQRLWKSLLTQKEQSSEENYQIKIHKMADVFHFVVTVLFRADIFLLMQKSKYEKRWNNKKTTLSEQEEKIIKNWFQSFLYEKKSISRDEILTMRNSGMISFKDASKILNQLCAYNEQQQIFSLSTTKVFKNIINQFPLLPQKQNYASLYGNTFKFNQPIVLQEGSYAKQLMEFALSASNIVPIFEAEWKRYLSKINQNDGQQKYAYLYLFTLVVYDALKNGENKQLKQKLLSLQSNVDALNELTANEDERSLIRKLMNIEEKKKQEKMEQEHTEVEKSPKHKNEQKKKKLEEKYKKKRELVLQKIKSQTGEAKIDESDEICILCHERTKHDNQMVYICSINKNNTICSAIHGKNSTAQTSINTCFHALHINCFINLEKGSDLTFECPLCKTMSNCVIPINYEREKKKLIKICTSAVIACMVTNYKVYDCDSNFMLIFKHLVQSLGLNAILQLTRYEQRKKAWIKNDDFLFYLLEDIYMDATEDERQQHESNIAKLIHDIKSNPNKQCQAIELLFAEALRQKLIDGTVLPNIKQLQLLRSLIQENQFRIIKEQYQRLSEPITMSEQSEEQKKMGKSNLGIKFINLPQKSTEAITKYSKKCPQCNEFQVEMVCLIDGQALCSNCREKHNQVHHNTTIYLQMGDLKVECNRKNFYTNDPVYHNQFKFSYEERNYYEGLADDEYILDAAKLTKVINKFLTN